MKKNKFTDIFKFAAAACLILGILLLSSCGDSSIVKSTKEDKLTVMTIGNNNVHRELFEYLMINYADTISDGNVIDWSLDENFSRLKNNVMSTLYDMYGVLTLAEKYDINPDSLAVKQQVDNEFNGYLAEYESEEDFRDDLIRRSMTDYVLRLILSVNVCRDMLLYAMIEDGTIPSDDNEIMKIINSDELIRIKQIFIKKSADTDKAEQLSLIQSLRSRAVSGEDFSELIDEYGHDWQMFSNPDGAYITRYQTLSEFENAAFNLKINEISDVVETSVGYSVILRLEKEEGYIVKNFNDLYYDVQLARLGGLIESKIDELKLDTDEKNAFSIYNPSSFTNAE